MDMDLETVVSISEGSLKVAYELLIFGINLHQVPDAVGRCIELVRTCHDDLKALIRHRDELLPLLRSKPDDLHRVNTIIERSRATIGEMARLVDRLRTNGRTPLRSRLEWMWSGADEFKSQEPLVSYQHRTILAELGFLRGLALVAPIVQSQGVGARAEPRPTVAWENLTLLDDMLGGTKPISRPLGARNLATPAPANSGTSPTPSVGTPVATLATNPASPYGPSTNPPPPYAPPTPSFTNHPWSSSGTASRPFVYNASVPATREADVFSAGQAPTHPRGASASVSGGVPFLYGDIKASFREDSHTSGTNTTGSNKSKDRKTTFDSAGAALLFGGHKTSSSQTGTNIRDGPHPLNANRNSQPILQPSLAQDWHTVDGQHSRRHTNLLSRLPNSYLDSANPSAPHLQAQAGSHFQQPTLAQPSWQQHHQPPNPLAPKPFSNIPQELLYRQGGIERPRSSCGAIANELPSDTIRPLDPTGAAAYATVRESWHFSREYRAGPHGGHGSAFSAPWGAFAINEADGTEVQRLRSDHYAPRGGDGGRLAGLAELSAVVFPPEPSELPAGDFRAGLSELSAVRFAPDPAELSAVSFAPDPGELEG